MDDTKDTPALQRGGLPSLAVAAGISALRRGRANCLSAELLVKAVYSAVDAARRRLEKERT